MAPADWARGGGGGGGGRPPARNDRDEDDGAGADAILGFASHAKFCGKTVASVTDAVEARAKVDETAAAARDADGNPTWFPLHKLTDATLHANIERAEVGAPRHPRQPANASV